MKEENKTKKQLINELTDLRQRVVELEKTSKCLNKQLEEFKKTATEVDKELDSISIELSISLSEVFEALKKISSGDPEVRIPEESELELISKLKYMINMTAKNIGEIVDQSHEFAIVLAEHFDVLHRISKGELSARVYGESKVELLEALKKVTNEMIESIDREITLRKQIEKKLMESEERYRRLFETSKDGILLIDRKTGNIININPAIVELSGYSSEKFIGKGLKDVGLLKDIEDIQEIIQKLDKAGFIYYDYVPLKTKGGQAIDTEIYLIDRAGVIQCNVRNITERKRAKEAMQKLRHQNEMILKSAGEGILGLDIHGNHIFVNPSAASMLGFTVEELIGKPSHSIYHHTKADGSLYPEEECPIYMAYKDGTVHSVIDEIFWRKDGTSFPVEYTSTPIEEDGKVVGAVVTFKDISELKRAEESLRETRKYLENLIDYANAPIIVWDPTLKITRFNHAFEYLTGYTADEVIGRELHILFPEASRGESLKKIERTSIGEYWEAVEILILRKDGEVRIALWNSANIYAPDGKTLLATIAQGQDFTERKRADEQIKQQLSRITALRNIDMAITASLDLHVTLNVFLEHVINQLHVDAATVLLLNPHTQTLDYGSSRGFQSDALKYTRLRLGEGHAGRAALERRIISIPNLTKVENSFNRSPLLPTEGFKAYFAVPIIAKGHATGVLEIFHRAMLEPDQEWLDFLEALSTQAAIAIDNASLFDKLQRSNIELVLAYDTTLEGWSKALDLRDKETEGHSQRVTEMTIQIARKMGVSDAELVHVQRGALLHDIGKMGVPDNILLKPGALNEEDWEIMRKHPVYAFELLSSIAFLRPALDIPYYHHEKWDGTGYPRGLKGEQIPLPARIFALVDVYDALNSDRPYRPAWPKEKVREYIQDQAGKHFDPKVVEVFLKIESEA